MPKANFKDDCEAVAADEATGVDDTKATREKVGEEEQINTIGTSSCLTPNNLTCLAVY